MEGRGEIPSSSSFPDNSLIGQTVDGVVEGSFGSGYFVTLKVQDTGRVLRGFIFKPGTPVPLSNIARRRAGTGSDPPNRRSINSETPRSLGQINEDHAFSQPQIPNPIEQEPYIPEPYVPEPLRYIDINEPLFSLLQPIPAPFGTVLNHEEPFPDPGDHHESELNIEHRGAETGSDPPNRRSINSETPRSLGQINEDHAFSQQQIPDPIEQEPYIPEPYVPEPLPYIDINEDHAFSQQEIRNPIEQEPYIPEPLPYIDLNEPLFSPLQPIPGSYGTVLNDEEPIPDSGDHHESKVKDAEPIPDSGDHYASKVNDAQNVEEA